MKILYTAQKLLSIIFIFLSCQLYAQDDYEKRNITSIAIDYSQGIFSSDVIALKDNVSRVSITAQFRQFQSFFGIAEFNYSYPTRISQAINGIKSELNLNIGAGLIILKGKRFNIPISAGMGVSMLKAVQYPTTIPTYVFPIRLNPRFFITDRFAITSTITFNRFHQEYTNATQSTLPQIVTFDSKYIGIGLFYSL